MKMLTFGCDKIMTADTEDAPLSDADLDRLIDRADKPPVADGTAAAGDDAGALQVCAPPPLTPSRSPLILTGAAGTAERGGAVRGRLQAGPAAADDADPAGLRCAL
jgi:hypothetical protein